VYQPSSLFRRTPEQLADQELSWQRSDQAFFAAGACHILGFAFQDAHPHAGFTITALRRRGHQHASHVYVSNGHWAFDHCGWTPETELLEATAAAEPDPPWERLPITTDLVTFCADHYHRPPHLFAHNPWPRAHAYLDRFEPTPPTPSS
jgi:hypothetical protein